MQTTAEVKNESGSSTDLQQYKKAAELAYRYAKTKAEEEQKPTEDFGAQDSFKQDKDKEKQ
jgi:hypothetical protein